jgi:hypothetical protein
VPVLGWDANGSGSIEEIIESSFFNINGNVPQVVEYILGQTLVDNTTTDLPGMSLFLKAGTYFMEAEGSAYITFSTAPSSARFDILVRKPDNSNFFVSEQVGMPIRTPNDMAVRESCGQIITLPTDNTAKVSARISATGGTGLTRITNRLFLKATKLSGD